jgi:hypothetical protein
MAAPLALLLTICMKWTEYVMTVPKTIYLSALSVQNPLGKWRHKVFMTLL